MPHVVAVTYVLTLLTVLAAFLVDDTFAQACTTNDMMDVVDIVTTCCESQIDKCAFMFPATCAHTCARLVVPYVDMCGSMLTVMPNEAFPFPIDG
jgi:hypothetical protein